MSDGQSSDEVAENYRDSLEYLITNDRYTINNLTVIAKENTEHAQAISKALEEHIRRAPPERKLPALYVLDSIVKNIGSPYTLFLGHNLYNTFMDAYSLVDSAVRKKLDEMLKTWKNPVPGSLEKRPVFPLEITKRIESALIQARTVALQQHQHHRREQEMLMRRGPPTANTFRNTPTPPQNITRFPPPNTQNYVQHHRPVNGNTYVEAQTRSPFPPFTQYPPPQVIPPAPQQPMQSYSLPQNYVQPNTNIESLHRDIENLISVAKADFAYNVHDTAVQARLKALLDLQTILRSQQLPPEQIQLIREQVTQLSSTPRVTQAPSVSAPQVVPIYSLSPPTAVTPNIRPTQFSPPSVLEMPSAASLAELLASAAKSQQTTPQPNSLAPPHAVPQQQLPPPQPPPVLTNPSQPSTNSASSLLASLRAAGLIPNVPSTKSPMSTSLLLSAQKLPTVHTSQIFNDVELTSVSVKKPRPHLISRLYEARPNQCSTCGKRFLNTEEDKKRKARHLDWHFRANIRLSESVRKVHSRSWYVDEMEWIRSRGNEEEGPNSAANGRQDSKGLGAAAKDDPKLKFIPVPSDSALASAPCSICQEKFEPSWNDEAQDFVWMDAIKIGYKVYHASCHAEITKGGANTPRLSTPESVLGKRKSEISSSSFSPAKLKKETIS